MNTPALFVAICSALNSHAQVQDFSYETDGKTLASILKELPKTQNLPLKVAPQFANDVFAIRLANGSADDLKAQIAKIEHAEWVERNGCMLLTQSSDEMREEAATHESYIETAFRDGLTAQAKQLDGQPPFDANGAALFAKQVDSTFKQVSDQRNYALALKALEPLSPSHRAVVRIANSLGPTEFANLPLRVKIYYSNQPTLGERQLPDTSTAAIARFLEEQTLWAKESASHTLPALSRGGVALSFPSFVADRQVPSGVPTKVLLSLYRESEYGRVFVDLKLADAEGQVLNRASASISPIEPLTSHLKSEPGGGLHPVVASERALQFTGLTGNSATKGEVRQALLHPEQRDPLAIAYGSTLIQASKDESCNLVAILADRLPDGGLRQSRYDTTVQYLESLAKKGQVSALDGKWLSVYPADLLWDRQSRVDRAVLGSYVRGKVAGNFSVEQEAESAANLPDPMENWLPPTILARLQNQMVGLKDVALLRFYGSLSTEERRQAQTPQGLKLSEITTPAALENLNEIVFGRTNPLLVPRKLRPELWREPSECLANGLDQSSVLHIAVTTKDAVFDLDRDNSPFQMAEGAISAAEVAFTQYQRQHPGKYPATPDLASNPNSPHFKVGQLKTYLFEFRFAPDVWTDATLEGRTMVSGEPLTRDQLPGSFLAEVSKSLAEIEKSEAQFGGPSPHPHTSSTP
jgi:hypothetical protein